MKRNGKERERSEREREIFGWFPRNNYSTIKEDLFYRNTQYTVVTQRRCAIVLPAPVREVGQDFHTGQTRRRLALVGGSGTRSYKRGEGPVSSPVFFRPVPLCKL